nr:putative capsid protein [Myrmica scabrinodis virus 1]
MLQPVEDQKIETTSRAKEIDHGTLPLTLENVMLGLPVKPGIQFDDRSSVNATKWTYDQLVSQKQLVQTISITPSTSSTTPVFAMRNGWKTIRDLHFRNLDNIFYFKSWKWHLTFEFRSNFQQVGMMTLSYVNLPADAYPYITGQNLSNIEAEPGIYKTSSKTVSNYNPGELDTLSSIYQLPHTLIMMGEDQDVECCFNWLSPFKSSFTEPYNDPYHPADWPVFDDPSEEEYDMGMIRLHVPVPMTLATGVNPNLTVRIWSHLTDVDYAGYIPQDTLL